MRNNPVPPCLRGYVIVAFMAFAVAPAVAQEWVTKPPTPADWTALSKLPDLTGVWEAPGGRAGAGPQPMPQLTATAAARKRELDAKNPDDTDQANCLPTGMPQIMGHPYPLEFLMTPGKLTIVAEAYMQVRHIHTDGRPLPADPDLTFNGTSIGRWQGDTLVVETAGFSPLTAIARNVPHGNNMRIVERFRLTGTDRMSVETTVTDPDVLAAPWTTMRILARHRDWTVREYICEENNRNFVDPQGKAGVTLKE